MERKFNSGSFVHDGSAVFMAEASSLGLEPGHMPYCLLRGKNQLGLYLISKHTGAESEWALMDKGAEFWCFKPTEATLESFPQLRGIRLLIYND